MTRGKVIVFLVVIQDVLKLHVHLCMWCVIYSHETKMSSEAEQEQILNDNNCPQH